MAEILTESFCERCGTRYTFESAARRASPLGVLGTVGRGIRNFVAMPDASLDEAFAVARAETEQGATAHQLEAFHRTFNFCLSCRQYTCAECWNAVEGRCLSCAPLPEPEVRADLADAAEAMTIATANAAPPFAAGPADLAWPVFDAAPSPDLVELPASGLDTEAEVAEAETVEAPPWDAAAGVEVAEPPEPEVAEPEPAEPEPAQPEPGVTVAEPEPEVVEEPEPEDAVAAWRAPAANLDAAEAEAAAELDDEPAFAPEAPEGSDAPDLESLIAAGAALGPMVAEALEPDAASEDEPDDSVELPAAEPEPPVRPVTFPGFEPGANLDAEIEAYDLRVAAVSQPVPMSEPREALAPAAHVADRPQAEAAEPIAPPSPPATRPIPVPESARLVERFVAASPDQRAVRSEAIPEIPEIPAADPRTSVPVAPVGTCPSCGLTLSASARFCRRCGTAQHA